MKIYKILYFNKLGRLLKLYISKIYKSSNLIGKNILKKIVKLII